MLDYHKDMTAAAQLKRVPKYLKPFDHFKKPSDNHIIKVAASIVHFNDTIKQIIETVKPMEIFRIGGAANKCCELAMGNVDTYMHPFPGLKYHDLCAPESLIKAMGGVSYNLYSERLTYPTSGDQRLRGLILAKNPEMYKMLKRRLKPLMNTILKKSNVKSDN